MNTAQFGPGGWDLLHVLAARYNPRKQKSLYRSFYIGLKDILPCKFCRRSYSQYIRELPVEQWLNSSKNMQKFTYLMHNKVNQKLRKQGLNDRKDPDFSCVYDRYRYRNHFDEKVWTFLYAIVFNFPTDDPKKVAVYHRFFETLAQIHPHRKIWVHCMKSYPIPTTRNGLIVWAYRLHCDTNKDMHRPIPCFHSVWKSIEAIRAKCGNKTCRKPLLTGDKIQY